MITENVSTLKIHKLTQAQYDRELEAGNLDETALYLTPDESESIKLTYNEFSPVIDDIVSTLKTSTNYIVNNGTKLVAGASYRIVCNCFGINTIKVANEAGGAVAITAGKSGQHVWLYYYQTAVGTNPAGSFKIVRGGDESLSDFDLQIYRIVSDPELDVQPTKGSDNIITSGGVFNYFEYVNSHMNSIDELIENISESGMVFRRVLSSDDDLNEITKEGFYCFPTASVPSNSPFINGSIVEVVATDRTDARLMQRVTRYGQAGLTAFRMLHEGTWLSWTYPLVTSDNANSLVADYVVGEGIDGSWTYRKWASGIAECWGNIETTIGEIATPSKLTGITYFAGSVKLPSFMLVSSKHKATVTATPDHWWAFGCRASHDNNNIHTNMYGMNSSMSDKALGDTYNVSYCVKGRWK